MRPTGAAHPTGTGHAGAARLGTFTADAGGEDGELLGQFHGTAMGAFGAFPIAGANQNFAVLTALFAMKFVNRHACILRERVANLKMELEAGPVAQG
jgi:hypothetical protein